MSDYHHHRRSHRRHEVTRAVSGLRGGRDRRILARYLSREARATAGFTAVVLLLFLLPLLFSAASKNRRMREQIDGLTREIDRLLQASMTNEMNGVAMARAAAAPMAVSAANGTTAAVGGPSPALVETGSGSPARSSVPLRSLAASRAHPRFTAAELTQLTNSLVLRPNGLRVGQAAATDKPQLDALAGNLIHGYSLLERGQKRDAEVVFGTILDVYPNWPFGYYYRALARNSRADMAHAADLFGALRTLDCLTLEGEIYAMLADLFLRNPEQAEAALQTLQLRLAERPVLGVGPLYAPRSAPNAFRRTLEKIPGLPVLQLTDRLR